MSFWNTYAARRVTRRRAMAAAGATSVGAALLAACGGSSGPSGPAASSLVYNPVDTTSQAKSGGTYLTTGTDPVTFNPHQTGNRNQVIAAGAFYPKLLKSKTVKYPDSTSDYTEPDLAESFELSPDRLKLTMKLRRGLKWDLASGRNIDAEDVVFSLQKMNAENPYRGNFSYNANPTQAVMGITAVDANTITINLHHPDPDLIGQIASPVLLVVMPREADTGGPNGFDSKQTVHGYGPWRMKDYNPGVQTTWTKNPDYYLKDRPFFQEVRISFVTEYATRLAQFKAGAIWTSQANLLDIISLKKEMPQLHLRLGERYGLDSGTVVIFSYTGPDGVPTRWNDIRVRQAIAYLMDREEYRDYATNEAMFNSEGIDIAAKPQGLIAPGWGDHYLNPMDEKEFGPNSKYYHLNIAEAKKLLTAAGFPNGFESKVFQGGDRMQPLIQQWAAGGLKIQYDIVQAGIFSTIAGAYNNGVNNGFGAGYQGHMATRAVNYYSSAAATIAGTDLPFGRSFMGATVDGTKPELGDPSLTSILTSYRFEFDKEKSKRLAWDYQRAAAEKCYRIPMWWSTLAHPGDTGAQGISLDWPVVGNLGVYRTTPGSYASLSYGGVSPGETMLHIYQDDTKAPLAK